MKHPFSCDQIVGNTNMDRFSAVGNVVSSPTDKLNGGYEGRKDVKLGRKQRIAPVVEIFGPTPLQ